MSITSHKEIEICGQCNGSGEIDVEQRNSGHDSEWVKAPCWQCATTGRRIKITTIQYLPFKGGENNDHTE
jgi:DnaJ-class molecular chaperone